MFEITRLPSFSTNRTGSTSTEGDKANAGTDSSSGENGHHEDNAHNKNEKQGDKKDGSSGRKTPVKKRAGGGAQPAEN